VLVDRANYGRLKPVMTAIDRHPRLELQTVVGGTMVLARFDQPMQLVTEHGFRVDGTVYMELEGSTPVTMAKSVGVGIVEFSSEFRRLQPDLVLIIGDRFEALSATIAAAYMNLCVVHLQGGEVSGSIDESARHAITKFAHYHVPSTRRAAENLVRMGERPDSILTIGCPSSDLARSVHCRPAPRLLNARGAGCEIDPDKPYQLVVFHPITTELGDQQQQTWALLSALDELANQTVLLWPNIDAGSDHISKTIRVFRDRYRPQWLRTRITFAPEDYLSVLKHAACAIGNSSSFVRDASFFGTPVVLVGDRQNQRERDAHVAQVNPMRDEIAEAVRRQLAHGRYAPSSLYGDGHVAARVADLLATLTPYVQKTLHYGRREERPMAA
jgi:UDP-hydrolysing UDP-N-acetyl-D-glucosamine 2-epimerase